ncbi:MAG: TIGR04283 family arsenosugar biosynthesis glycosyltransferase [Pseudomonadota bacterium]
MMDANVSIIIPALNEAAALPATLRAIGDLNPAPHEIILVDGGSSDDTILMARPAGLTIIESPKGRAKQMNAGAAAATGDMVCFLHADTLLPPDAVGVMRQTLADRRTAAAGFISVMTGDKPRLFTTAHNFIKTWYAPFLFRPLSALHGCRLLFGDQAIFCRADDFRAIGGFDPDQTIMEEADFVLRMTRAGRGRIRQIWRTVHSSDRRVAEWGGLKANLVYIYIGALWGFGAAPKRLSRLYEDVR